MPGNHQFIQGLLEHGLDLRPLQTKRTAKRDVPTAECVSAVEAILASSEDDEGQALRFGHLMLVPPPVAERRKETHDLELKRMLDEMRRRLPVTRNGGGADADGQDAA